MTNQKKQELEMALQVGIKTIGMLHLSPIDYSNDCGSPAIYSTCYGPRTVEGIGAIILRIVENSKCS